MITRGKFRKFIFFILTFICISIPAQDDNRIYFDKDWVHSDPDNAKYYLHYEIKDSVLEVSYHMASGTIFEKGQYQSPPKGTNMLEYFLNNEEQGNEVGSHFYYKKNGDISLEVIYDPFETLDPLDKVDNNFPDSIKSRLKYEKVFFSNGNIKEEGFTIDNKSKHGQWTRYTRNGYLFFTADFHFGKLDGKFIYYFNDGSLVEMISYKKGIKSGETIKYDLNGNPKKKIIYKEGKIITKEKLNN
ncbi:hypothetical protein OO013_05015 [Mangrovivirga sp. M17]|uniref:Antitoxin component YwqK of YwqJK toxin-antitoxin module n=1 Tax=Mangrovivirga halotolerans TaxID=2993936 RepID=A0ABT3RN18_9BACT|nr:hypothetical protein [Mangrovivirga halotolerans]MCX2743213.1 hypothetical protein [Mangrovivirga halotolerans]